jgi:hypothetical protein
MQSTIILLKLLQPTLDSIIRRWIFSTLSYEMMMHFNNTVSKNWSIHIAFFCRCQIINIPYAVLFCCFQF